MPNKKSYKNKRITFIASSIIIMITCAAFIISNFQDEIVFFYSPSDLLQKEVLSKTSNRKIRVGGLVLKGSVIKKDALNISFKISDNEKELLISYEGLTPDLFREGQGIIANGKYDEKNSIFIASQLLVKHDENYIPPEVAKSIKHELKK